MYGATPILPLQVTLFIFLALFVGLVVGACLAFKRSHAEAFTADAEPWQELWQVLAALACLVMVMLLLTAMQLSAVAGTAGG